jgi:hypothetical protein
MDWRREPGTRPEFLEADNSFKLLVPITYQQGDTPVTLDRLQLRRLTGKERRTLDGPGLHTDKLLTIASEMTGLPVVVLEKWDSVDQDRVDDVLGYFMEPGSVTTPIS